MFVLVIIITGNDAVVPATIFQNFVKILLILGKITFLDDLIKKLCIIDNNFIAILLWKNFSVILNFWLNPNNLLQLLLLLLLCAPVKLLCIIGAFFNFDISIVHLNMAFYFRLI